MTTKLVLSPSQTKAVAALKEHGHIDVTYWGASVWSMSVKGNDRTLKALVNKGLATRTQLRRETNNTVRYELTAKGKAL